MPIFDIPGISFETLELDKKQSRASLESFSFTGAECLVFIGARWHCQLGGWIPQGPASWTDPNKIMARADYKKLNGDVLETIDSAYLQLKDFAPQPTFNDTIDISTFLIVRPPTGVSTISLWFMTELVALPDLNGKGPFIAYIFGNVSTNVDGAFAFSKNYTTSQPGNLFHEDAILLETKPSK